MGYCRAGFGCDRLGHRDDSQIRPPPFRCAAALPTAASRPVLLPAAISTTGATARPAALSPAGTWAVSPAAAAAMKSSRIMRRTPALARQLYDRFEPIHALTYFAPEVRAALDHLGYRGFWMGYFAARSAPLGVVPPEVVTAVFYNFAHARVARSLPAAWEIAGPDRALYARLDSTVAALRRCGVTEDENVSVAVDLAMRAARVAPVDGRALFAANVALPVPSEPVAALWHATTLLREHRGDGHVAALVAAGISGRESNVFHTAASAVSEEFMKRSRHYDDDEWEACRQSLADRGLLDAAGSLTPAGRDLKDQLETSTDALALRVFDALDDDELHALFNALTPVARTVIAAGDVPAATPMSARLDF